MKIFLYIVYFILKLTLMYHAQTKKITLHSFSKSIEYLSVIDHFISINNDSDESFYIVDLGEVAKKYIQWKKLIPRVHPYYAVKCNPDNEIIKTLGMLGANFDCASKEEFDIVLSNDISSDRIIYANPCKSKSHIKYSKERDIKYLVIDSENELYKIKDVYPEANIIIRLKVDDSGSLCKFSTKFGCSNEDAENIMKIGKENDMNIVGVSFHIGSNCKSKGYYHDAIKNAKYIFDIAKDKYDIKMELLDIGGGFLGVDEADITFEDFANEINNAINKYIDDDINIISEPGRYFVTSSHTLITHVIGKKCINNDEKEFKYTLSDGIYKSFNCVMFDHIIPTIIPVKDVYDSDKKYKTTLFGPTCDSMDTISSDTYLVELNIGDWCYIPNFGAYTRASSSNFNGFNELKVYYYTKLS